MDRSYETVCADLKKKYETLLIKNIEIKILKYLVLIYRYRQFWAETDGNNLTDSLRKQKADQIRQYLDGYSEAVKDSLPLEEIMKQIQKEAAGADEILNDFQKDLKTNSRHLTRYLMHVTAWENLTAVTSSHRKLNMYHTAADSAVFATSSRSHALLYAGRILGGSMQVLPKQRICVYQRNPFTYETENIWKLRRPVHICLLEYQDFVPVIDFIEVSPGNFRICFEHEWTALKKTELVRSTETLKALDKRQLEGYRFYSSEQNGLLKRIG